MAPSAREQIERINTLSAIARTSWLAMLGYFAFVGVTLLSVRDHDFFMTARQTKLPLVDVSIPTFSFFVFAPVLGAALYIYLHLHLLKLWDALAATWPRIEDEPVGERLHPWIANDFALARKGRQALRPRPLRWVGHVATWALVWLLGPFVLAGFWWRSMPAHSELLTLALGAALLASLYAGWVSWRAARDWLPERSDRPGPWRRWWRPPLAALAVALVVTVGWARTEGGAEWWVSRAVDLANWAWWGDPTQRDTMGFLRKCYPVKDGRENTDAEPDADCVDEYGALRPRNLVQEARIRGIVGRPSDDSRYLGMLQGLRCAGVPVVELPPLARTDLRRIEMVDVPESWRTPETARHAFRQQWCQREGLAMGVCDHPETVDRRVAPAVWRERLAWCGEELKPEAECRGYFAGLDTRFETAWTEERDAALANLPRLNLAGRDLRRAEAQGATLIRADLSEARLEGADLFAARLEGANLSEARLEGANLSEARLEGADLSEARLEGAVLRRARLEGANLSEARLEGAVLWFADFRRTNWAGASNRASPAQFADLRAGQDLTQAQVEHFVGNRDTLLPEGPNENGEDFYVWSCWETPPEGFEALVERLARNAHEDPESLRAQLLCGRHERIKTGTPWPLDKARPERHPLGP